MSRQRRQLHESRSGAKRGPDGRDLRLSQLDFAAVNAAALLALPVLCVRWVPAGIGEGDETYLAARLAGFRPVWALGSAGTIPAFPVLSGTEAITVLGEVGDGRTNDRAAKASGACWIAAGRNAWMVEPQVSGDLNDVSREVAP